MFYSLTLDEMFEELKEAVEDKVFTLNITF
jgi:hypothetical protein